ncbi:MAG: hypothetical protein DMD87_24625 [Candidatus Rokuibacteriota bacterium]|nr:MAG: hypothetical protein DMD87_24625 [Candidatus Rokubacteria bacterium]
MEQLEAADLLLPDVGGELLGGTEGGIEHGRPPAPSSSLRSAIEVYCVSYVPPGASVTESIPPHPVLEEYYRVKADRQSFVDELFDGAARYYNHIGRMLDLGSGPMYRRQALQRAGLKPGMRLLDVATGTGLVARGGAEVLGDPRRVIGIDPNSGMLREARMALSGPLVRGRAEVLPFRSDSFDMLSMGFALRHVEDLEIAFDEYRRVLKPGGRLLLLEVSRPTSRIMRWVIRTHFQRVLPWLTRISTGNDPAGLLMRYYWDTIDRCVPPETILDVLRRNGFVDVTRRVYVGFLSEYVAAKPRRSVSADGEMRGIDAA